MLNEQGKLAEHLGQLQHRALKARRFADGRQRLRESVNVRGRHGTLSAERTGIVEKLPRVDVRVVHEQNQLRAQVRRRVHA